MYYIYHTIQKQVFTYRSEYNNKRRKQVILLMITNGKKYHYLAVTNLSALLQGNSKNLNCIGENMEKYITFSVPIKKECDGGKTITRKLRFIDSFRFISTSLSELVDNISGIFNSIECKSCIEKIINLECCFVDLKNNC